MFADMAIVAENQENGRKWRRMVLGRQQRMYHTLIPQRLAIKAHALPCSNRECLCIITVVPEPLTMHLLAIGSCLYCQSEAD